MRRVHLLAPEQIAIGEAARPTCRAGEALIRVSRVGICGSDIHAYHGQHPFIQLPVVPGHEFTGVIDQVGDGGDNEWVGKRVTAVPSLVCGRCYNCRHGRYNICNELRVIGCQADGAMAEYVVVPADMLVPLPDEMSMETGALIEPLAVAVGAVERGGQVGGSRVVVFGAGTIGLFVLQVLRAYGAREVVVVDPLPDRLALAAALGADFTVNPRETDLLSWALHRWGPDGIDLSFECVGIADTVNQAIRVNRKGTRVVVVGVFGTDACVTMGLVQDREIELVGTLMYRKEHFATASWLLATGRVQGAPLVTHRFPLEEAASAFGTCAIEKGKAVKVILEAD